MQLTVRLIHETDQRLWQRLDVLYAQNEILIETQGAIMATIKELVASVAEVKGKADSIGMLITQLREQITGLTQGNLPADVQAQVDQAFADAEAAKAELSTAVDASPGSAPKQDAPPPANVPFNTPAPGMPFGNPPMPVTGSPAKTDADHS